MVALSITDSNRSAAHSEAPWSVLKSVATLGPFAHPLVTKSLALPLVYWRSFKRRVLIAAGLLLCVAEPVHLRAGPEGSVLVGRPLPAVPRRAQGCVAPGRGSPGLRRSDALAFRQAQQRAAAAPVGVSRLQADRGEGGAARRPGVVAGGKGASGGNRGGGNLHV